MIGTVYGYYVKHSGIGRYISEILKNFEKTHNFELITMEKSLPIPSGVSTYSVDCNRDRRFMSIKENENFSQAVQKVSKKYKILHSHGIYQLTPDLYTAHICLKSYFNTFTDIFEKSKLPKHLKDFSQLTKLEEEMLSKIYENKLVAVSNKVANEISEAYGIEKKKIEVIPGASRFYKQEDDLPNKSRSKSGFNIGFVGGNLYAKGICFIKEVLNELSSREKMELQCVGVGCNRDIKNFLDKNSKYRTRILGKVNIGKDFYKQLDAFLCLSAYEGYSLSTIEAMSLGVPVISSKLNGVFHDAKKNLALACVDDISNTKEVADELENVLLDKDFRTEVINTGYKIANNRTWKNVSCQYERIYEEILGDEL